MRAGFLEGVRGPQGNPKKCGADGLWPGCGGRPPSSTIGGTPDTAWARRGRPPCQAAAPAQGGARPAAPAPGHPVDPAGARRSPQGRSHACPLTRDAADGSGQRLHPPRRSLLAGHRWQPGAKTCAQGRAPAGEQRDAATARPGFRGITRSARSRRAEGPTPGGESGFDSGERACETARTSKDGSRRGTCPMRGARGSDGERASEAGPQPPPRSRGQGLVPAAAVIPARRASRGAAAVETPVVGPPPPRGNGSAPGRPVGPAAWDRAAGAARRGSPEESGRGHRYRPGTGETG